MYFDSIEFGQRLKKARKERGLTQEQLASILNITTNHLGKIELGKREVSIDVLFELSEILDVSIDVLVKGKKHFSAQTLHLIGQMRAFIDQLEEMDDLV